MYVYQGTCSALCTFTSMIDCLHDMRSHDIELRILQVKSRLYENTEVRYNNALFHVKRSTQLMKGLGSNLCRKIK